MFWSKVCSNCTWLKIVTSVDNELDPFFKRHLHHLSYFGTCENHSFRFPTKSRTETKMDLWNKTSPCLSLSDNGLFVLLVTCRKHARFSVHIECAFSDGWRIVLNNICDFKFTIVIDYALEKSIPCSPQ